MHFPNFLVILLLPLALAAKPTPVRPFIAAAFQSPYPSGSPGSLSGVPVTASGGKFYLNPDTSGPKVTSSNGTQTVFWVDLYGQAWLNSKHPQQVYLDTQTGDLSYLSPVSRQASSFSPGAVVANFLHLGEGTVVDVPIPGAPGFYNGGPGEFQWQGSRNDYWFACPRAGKGYQVLKNVGGKEDWNKCTVVQLIALDDKDTSPAASAYL
ncbi:hypothetical protein B0O99DRAFT_595249 [Bisporella sp. PMI_857]|nr:hypothetical protein B0O99DRAFT_595249 [Bisporella sp. PMI_857]